MTDETTALPPVRSPRGGWRVPAGLLGLSAIPLVAGALRMTELAGGAAIIPESAAAATPLPLTLHILAVTVYSALGAFQFVPRLRRRRNGWHRRAGRLLVGSGLLAAFTGLWMTLVAHPADDGGLLVGFRLVFGTAMAVSIMLGFAAIRRRDFIRHRAWMIRGYAIGLGAGTQAFTHTFGMLIVGVPDDLTRAWLLGAGWVINVCVAEWLIRRRRGQAVLR